MHLMGGWGVDCYVWGQHFQFSYSEYERYIVLLWPHVPTAEVVMMTSGPEHSTRPSRITQEIWYARSIIIYVRALNGFFSSVFSSPPLIPLSSPFLYLPFLTVPREAMRESIRYYTAVQLNASREYRTWHSTVYSTIQSPRELALKASLHSYNHCRNAIMFKYGTFRWYMFYKYQREIFW